MSFLSMQAELYIASREYLAKLYAVLLTIASTTSSSRLHNSYIVFGGEKYAIASVSLHCRQKQSQ